MEATTVRLQNANAATVIILFFLSFSPLIHALTRTNMLTRFLDAFLHKCILTCSLTWTGTQRSSEARIKHKTTLSQTKHTS